MIVQEKALSCEDREPINEYLRCRGAQNDLTEELLEICLDYEPIYVRIDQEIDMLLTQVEPTLGNLKGKLE